MNLRKFLPKIGRFNAGETLDAIELGKKNPKDLSDKEKYLVLEEQQRRAEYKRKNPLKYSNEEEAKALGKYEEYKEAERKGLT